jgi:membrane protease YdiL (CAAX protease family)
VLFSVSLLLTYVRVKTRSVAASAIVHSAYNAFVFLTVLLATGGYRHLDRMAK